jgi:hypothetical protein
LHNISIFTLISMGNPYQELSFGGAPFFFLLL